MPVHGGVVLDLCGLSGIVDVDATSLVLDVLPGTFGDHLEDELRADHGVTLGHWPQSVALSTVGGWLACRSAGQLSTRYGKIEDMVVGLDVALADGRRIRTGGAPRAGGRARPQPALRRLRGHARRSSPAPGCGCTPPPPTSAGPPTASPRSTTALDAMRRILQRGATPAVLRLYDAAEADRTYHTGDRALLLVLDEGDGALVDADDGARRRGVPRRRTTTTSPTWSTGSSTATTSPRSRR